MSEILSPTTSHRLASGAVEVYCFGAQTRNWGLKGWSRGNAEANNPGITNSLDALVHEHGIKRLFLPSPNEFNGKIVGPKDFSCPWPDGRIFRGVYAEGVVLEEIGDACAIASADCPTIVACNPGTGVVAVAHAGRESLYDRAGLFDHAPPRRHESVVDAIVEALGLPIVALVTCGISAEMFRHSLVDSSKGVINLAMITHLRKRWGQACAPGDCGQIDLVELIRAQFDSKGVPRDHVAHQGTCTFETLHSKRLGYVWHSHRRDGAAAGRNLVLAIRRD